ncbi:4Fe-4S dicluster domain-containing protein [Chloroflexota bacterium]
MELPSAKYIKLDVDKCAGCSTCEAVCSLSHEGVISPQFSRLIIIDYYLEGHRIKGYICRQCPNPECLRVCPTKALHVDEKTRAVVISPEECNGCKLCIEACPQYPNTPIRYDADRKVCLKCDLCGGNPLCVKFCPEGALSLLKKGV